MGVPHDAKASQRPRQSATGREERIVRPRHLWRHVAMSLVAAGPVGGFFLGILRAGDPDPNPLGRVAHALLMSVMTPLRGGFPPHFAAGEGRTFNAWPQITAAFLLILTWPLYRDRTPHPDGDGPAG